MRLCLLAASVLFAFLLCEAALRLFFPKYQNVARGHLHPDDLRLLVRPINHRGWAVHPDTRRRHAYHTNNLGLRQHRNFSDADILSTTTVGVFGDSFVESVTLDAPYVFTEPLDYLLNLDGKFTVLNFGVGGYGPAQSYFTYRTFPAREDLDYVLFVYYGGNDLVDLVNNGLFDLDDGGRLQQREVRGSAWWVPFASRLHSTYLVLDATGRLAPYVASLSDDLPKHDWIFKESFLSKDLLEHGLEVFGQLIRRWSAEVEESGGRFLVVLLPTQADYPRVRPLLEEAGVGVVDLNACYASRDQGHRGRAWMESPYSLKDGHWNELGNRLAAACLDDRLRLEAGLPALAEAARDAVLSGYYAAFGSPKEPPPPEGESPRSRRSIERKYQALGGFDATQALIPGFSPELPDLDKRVFDSTHWDVYIHEDWLFFLKDDCQADGDASQLFANATPVDASPLPSLNYGSLHPTHMMPPQFATCISEWLMRDVVSHIHVGEGNSATGIRWSAEILLDRRAFEKVLNDMLAAAGEPVIESDMDVHVHGRRIFYVSDDCRRTDGRTPFFLHVTPLHEADLPPARIEHGYDNWDFFQAAVTVGERCVVRWSLPNYPIGRIVTGQYEFLDADRTALRLLWEGETDIGG